MRRAERAGPGAAHLLGAQIAAVQDFQRREELIPEIFLAAADAGQGRGGLQHAAVAHLGRVVRFDAPDRRDRIAVDAIGFFRRIELRLVFGQDLAALGQAIVVDQNVEIIPDRLGEFRLRIHQIHDAQIGRKPRGKTLKALLRDVAAGGVGPHRGDAIVEIRRRLPDRARGHQRMAGGAVLAAPGQRRAACGGRACACAGVLDFWPEKMLPSRFEIPSPDDCARTSPANRSMAANRTMPVRRIIDGAVCRIMSCPSLKHPGFTRPGHGFQQLNKGRIALPGFRLNSAHPPLFRAANRLPTCDQSPSRTLSRRHPTAP